MSSASGIRASIKTSETCLNLDKDTEKMLWLFSYELSILKLLLFILLLIYFTYGFYIG